MTVIRGGALMLIAIGIPIYHVFFGAPGVQFHPLAGPIVIIVLFGLGALMLGGMWMEALRHRRFIQEGILTTGVFTSPKNWEGVTFTYFASKQNMVGQCPLTLPVEVGQTTWIVHGIENSREFFCIHDLLLGKLGRVTQKLTI